ncbi:hypothetical protein [Microtetraspora malaysiensis]|uniref:hypothetical protein n=1 Tax=Microtetraspora malaysiensis TaxID=161358 RepID=UPI0012FAE0F7|nr:hypothetical protein [Microtetraspora malaysiensis]
MTNVMSDSAYSEIRAIKTKIGSNVMPDWFRQTLDVPLPLVVFESHHPLTKLASPWLAGQLLEGFGANGLSPLPGLHSCDHGFATRASVGPNTMLGTALLSERDAARVVILWCEG